jgi:hypothetical protein
MLGKYNLVIGKRYSGKTTYVINYLKNIHSDLNNYTITILSNSDLKNSSILNDIFELDEGIKSKKIQIYDSEYFFNFAFENTFKINPSNINPSNINPSNINPSNINPSNINPSNINPSNINPQGHIIIIEDGFLFNYTDEKVSKFFSYIKSNLSTITLIQEMQFLQKKFIFTEHLPDIYLTKETNKQIIDSTYKMISHNGMFESFGEFENLVLNIKEYDFVKIQ